MQAPYATAQDVADIWRPLTSNETTVVESRIMSASRLVARRVRQQTGADLDGLITAGSIDYDDVKDIVVEMAFRAVSRPGFTRQESVTVDDGTISRTIDASVSGKSGVFITDDELATLLVAWGTPDTGAFSIAPGW